MSNPRSLHLVKNAAKKCLLPKHCPNSESALSPVELKNSHDKLLPNLCNNVYNLQLWVMMLFGVKLFLRGDEILSFKHEDITKEPAVISFNGTIECLPMKMLGK